MYQIIENNIEYLVFFITVLFYVLLYIFIKGKMIIIDKKLNDKYALTTDEVTNFGDLEEEDKEEHIKYYKYKNFLAFARYGTLFWLLTFLIVHKLPNFFSFFAIWVWAIIITFKEIILSFFWYFYISTKYKIGENLVFLEGRNYIRGEIIYMNALNTGLVWKDENGESNGQLFRIPNHRFFFDFVKQENIWVAKYKKERVKIMYSREFFGISFDEFVEKLSEYLETTLPKRNINNVWYYKTFIGYKYKMRFKYDEDKVIIKVHFIVKPKNVFEVEKWLYSFVESLRKEPETKEK